MALVVDITSGARAGARENFTRPIIVAGRHPHSDLRFDAQKDLDVSTRHAEFRSTRDGWTVQDLGSTNGTFVNGRPISSSTPVKIGDQVKFGEKGPTVQIVSAGPVGEAVAPPRTEMRSSQGAVQRPKTEERIAMAVARQTSRLTQFVVALGIIVVIGVGALVWLNQKQARDARVAIEKLIARGDSLTNALQQAMAEAGTRAAGFDSVERVLREERTRLRQQLAAGGNAAQITTQLDALQRRGNQALQLTNREISDANGKAVAYIVVQSQAEKNFRGTAFGVTTSGLLVTNRHLLLDDEGRPPKQIAIQFADTRAVLHGRFVSTSPTADLGFIQVVEPGEYPTVRGVASSASIATGDAIAMIGFPSTLSLGTEESGVKANLTAGFVSSVLEHQIRMNLFAAEGSSGSPVFDSRGYVVGVLYAGTGGTSSNITVAVPGSLLVDALPPEARGIIKR